MGDFVLANRQTPPFEWEHALMNHYLEHLFESGVSSRISRSRSFWGCVRSWPISKNVKTATMFGIAVILMMGDHDPGQQFDLPSY